jgi:hypothetical protein
MSLPCFHDSRYTTYGLQIAEKCIYFAELRCPQPTPPGTEFRGYTDARLPVASVLGTGERAPTAQPTHPGTEFRGYADARLPVASVLGTGERVLTTQPTHPEQSSEATQTQGPRWPRF